jgi:hypothetical protein
VGSKFSNTVGTSTHNHDTEREDFDVLLKLKISVKGDKYITDTMCTTKQIAILYLTNPDYGSLRSHALEAFSQSPPENFHQAVCA